MGRLYRHQIRAKVKLYGIRVLVEWSRGYFIPAQDKEKLKRLLWAIPITTVIFSERHAPLVIGAPARRCAAE